jgi:CreA protein
LELSRAVRLLVKAAPGPHMGTCWRACARFEEDGMDRPLRFRRARASATRALIAALAVAPMVGWPGYAADEPDLIFKRSTVFHWMSPNDKLATYALDDPEVEGVACHFTVPERGGFKGWIGVAEEVSDISLACRQTGPIRFKDKFPQGDEVFRKRRSLFFKKMQIVRGCDVKRNVLVYVVYSDRLIEGSPKNSTSTVPIMPWGADAPPKCADWLEK